MKRKWRRRRKIIVTVTNTQPCFDVPMTNVQLHYKSVNKISLNDTKSSSETKR